jgi:hypothetical protein
MHRIVGKIASVTDGFRPGLREIVQPDQFILALEDAGMVDEGVIVKAKRSHRTVEQASQAPDVRNVIGFVHELLHVVEPTHQRLHQSSNAV